MNSSRKEDEKGRRKPTQIIFFPVRLFLGTSSAVALRAEQTAWYQHLGNGSNKGMQRVILGPTCFPHKFIHPQKTAPGLYGPKHHNMKPGPQVQQICGILCPFVDPRREGSCISQLYLGFTSPLLGFKGVTNARPIAIMF